MTTKKYRSVHQGSNANVYAHGVDWQVGVAILVAGAGGGQQSVLVSPDDAESFAKELLELAEQARPKYVVTPYAAWFYVFNRADMPRDRYWVGADFDKCLGAFRKREQAEAFIATLS